MTSIAQYVFESTPPTGLSSWINQTVVKSWYIVFKINISLPKTWTDLQSHQAHSCRYLCCFKARSLSSIRAFTWRSWAWQNVRQNVLNLWIWNNLFTFFAHTGWNTMCSTSILLFPWFDHEKALSLSASVVLPIAWRQVPLCLLFGQWTAQCRNCSAYLVGFVALY